MESESSNPPIDVAGLPTLASEDFSPLDPNFLKVRFIGDAFLALFVVAAAAVAWFFLPVWIPIVVGAVLLTLIALSAVFQIMEVKYIGYLVRSKDFSYRSGVLSKTVESVPFARVQNVRLDQGPIQRWFNLSSLHIKTAGAGIDIFGLSESEAKRIQALIVDRSGALAESELADDSG